MVKSNVVSTTVAVAAAAMPPPSPLPEKFIHRVCVCVFNIMKDSSFFCLLGDSLESF